MFADRRTRLATLGYLGHMWELYAVWTWIATFAAASLGVAGGATPSSPAGSAVAFAAIGSGALGSAAAGVFADRIGKARVATWAMLVSGACCAAAGFVFHAPPVFLFVFAVVWGIAVVADSAQLSALVAQYSPREHVGTALTIQTCAGFLLTMASIRLLPVAAQAIGWQWVFLCLVPGPFLGAWALRGLGSGDIVPSPCRGARQDLRRDRGHRVVVVDEPPGLGGVVLLQVVRPPEADRLEAQFHVDLQRTVRAGHIDGIANTVGTARKVGVLRRASHDRDVGIGRRLVEPARQEAVVLQVPHAAQQTGRRRAGGIAHHRLVDLHLIGLADLGVVRLEPRRIGVVVVPLDRPGRGQRARTRTPAVRLDPGP